MISEKSLANLRPAKKGENRFTHKKHPDGYFGPKLKKLLEGKMPVTDEKIRALFKNLGMKETIGNSLLLSLLMAGVQNQDISAIKEIFDRIDGKVAQKLIGEGIADQHYIIIRNPEAIKEENDRTALSNLPKETV